MRCSLGYALRTEDEVCKCLSVTGPSECWQSADGWENLAMDEEPAKEDSTARAAD